MSEGDACPLPTSPRRDEADVIARMIRAKRIAVVGLSDDPSRASHGVASYLQMQGCTILPVNPNLKTVLSERCYASLEDVPGPIDIVGVFRRPEFCAEIVREAIEVRAKGVWLQSGIKSEEARKLAAEAGIDFVQNRCLMVEHMHGS